MKCEVLKDSVLHIQKGSIVEVSERQFELARRVLKPIEVKAIKTSVEEEIKAEAPKRKKKKAEETAEE